MIDREFGHYRVTEFLGSGAMGNVYKARDTHLNRDIALKFLNDSWISDPEALERFQREARTASSLTHPNIRIIHDIGEVDHHHYIVMECLEGWTLREYLKDRNLTVDEILEWGIQLSSALDYAHSKGIIHRDINPSNIFVTETNQLKILDFGLAKPVDPSASDENITSAGSDLTSPGTLVGTLGYISPEQARGENIDGRSDVFSFGAVLYEMAARHRAFVGETHAVVYDSILNRALPSVRLFNPEIPAELDSSIISRALEKDRTLRYQTAADLLADMRRLKRNLANSQDRSSQTETPSDSTVTRLSRRRLAGFVTGSAALGFVAGGSIMLMNSQTDVRSIAVIPFSNSAGGEAERHIADRLTERVRGNLVLLQRLFVHPESTVSQFGGANLDPARIRQELNVDAIVVGEVDAADSTVFVNLMDLRSEVASLWERRYPINDLLSVPDSIVDDITAQLEVVLRGEDLEEIETERIYQQARELFAGRNEADLFEARLRYQDVLERDSSHAEAWAGLALVEAVLPIYSSVNPVEYLLRARTYADAALRIRPIADAYNARALVSLYHDRDWNAAHQEYLSAIRIDRNNATTHQWLAEYQAAIGDFQAALDRLEEAESIEPTSLVIPSVRGWVLYYAGRTQEATSLLLETLRRDASFGLAYRFLGAVYVETQQYPEAIAALEQALELEAGPQAYIAYALARSGDEDAARDILEQLLARTDRGEFVSQFDFAIIHAGLGDADRAFESLQASLDTRPWDMITLNVDPMFSSLRSDPRFEEVVRGLGLNP